MPWQIQTCYFGGDCGWACFCPIEVIFVLGEPLCGVGTPSWALISLFRVIYWKESGWLPRKPLSDPLRGRNVLFWGKSLGWALFWPIHAVFVVGEPFCGVGTGSWALKTLLRVIQENGVVGCQCNSCRIPWQSATCYFGGDLGWACFWPIQAVFAVGEPLCDVGTSSWALITLLRVI